MKQVSQFFKEVKTELYKVEWPKRSEFLGATIVTLILVFIFTVYIGLIDRLIAYIIYENLFNYIKV